MTEPRDPISMSRQDYQYFMGDLANKRDEASRLRKRVKHLERVTETNRAEQVKRERRWAEVRDTVIQMRDLLDEIIQEHYEEEADHPDEYWS